MTTLVQSMIDGILIGSIYAVVAVGLTLLFGVARIVNFAHGACVMAAAYADYEIHQITGWDPYAIGLLIVPGSFGIGALYYIALLHRAVGRDLMGQSLLTIGVSLVLVSGALAIFGPDVLTFSLSYGTAAIHVGPFTLVVTQLIAFGGAVATTVFLWGFLRYTDFGIQLRASAADSQTALLMGLRAHRVQMLATCISMACAAVGGVLLLPIVYVSPDTGNQFTFLAFVIVVLGGLGSFVGALLGGVLIGIAGSLGAAYLTGTLTQAGIYLLFIVVLVLRPNGIFRRAE